MSITCAIPWDRTVRSGLVLAAALVGAVVCAGPASSTIVVIGAVCSINADCSGSFVLRCERLAAVVLAGCVGTAVGCLAGTACWAQILAMAVTGLAAGFFTGWGPGGTLAGLKLMVLTAMGFSLGGSVPVGHAVLFYSLGCVPMALLLAGAGPGRPGATKAAPRVSLSAHLRCAHRWRNGIRLSICMALAALAAALLHPDHSAWLPLTAALVFRLEDDSVVPRTMHRAVGTVIGVLAAAVLVQLPAGWALLLLALLVGAVLPGATDKAYALHTALVSVIVLVLAHPTTRTAPATIAERLVDTLIACAIVLVFCCLVWPQRRRGPAIAGGAQAS
ncbi:FUSC family protein [Streptomyces sp. AV19]|uniref:FUSC family protein n=1 Tax=Streptomyces sp. AV19 TaxID=2793068 RepID=UPI0018FE3923|nr:FUSC family protein [Streptomyces sp. AV19]MBH1937955.1 FUSC family protein [Streptomyces sp. AV19]MDG4536894.1 FUSC family protein [Streptomyces sp. AV19]